MDPQAKARRYRRKEYSDIVDFPVEIVGRDGVVRRYPFEASIRLYERRLRFAGTRFHDEDVVRAEIGHCRARMEQLRRSYFHLNGWTAADGEPGPEVLHAAHAGDLAAFLGRALGTVGRLALKFRRLPGALRSGTLWYVDRGDAAPSLLLYAWTPLGEAESAELADTLRVLRAAEAAGGDTERVVAEHRGSDCTFLLTGAAAAVSGMVVRPAVLEDEPSPHGDPLDEIVALARSGRFDVVADRARWLWQDQPWHGVAYRLGAGALLALGQASAAEDVAYVGHRFLPEDVPIATMLGRARLMQGRAADALAPLTWASAQPSATPTTQALRFVAALGVGGRVAVDAAWSARSAPVGSELAEISRAVRRGAVVGAIAGGLAVAETVAAWMDPNLLAYLPATLVVGAVGVAICVARVRALVARVVPERSAVDLTAQLALLPEPLER